MHHVLQQPLYRLHQPSSLHHAYRLCQDKHWNRRYRLISCKPQLLYICRRSTFLRVHQQELRLHAPERMRRHRQEHWRYLWPCPACEDLRKHRRPCGQRSDSGNHKTCRLLLHISLQQPSGSVHGRQKFLEAPEHLNNGKLGSARLQRPDQRWKKEHRWSHRSLLQGYRRGWKHAVPVCRSLSHLKDHLLLHKYRPGSVLTYRRGRQRNQGSWYRNLFPLTDLR